MRIVMRSAVMLAKKTQINAKEEMAFPLLREAGARTTSSAGNRASICPHFLHITYPAE
jgi:hypothetical protein